MGCRGLGPGRRDAVIGARAPEHAKGYAFGLEWCTKPCAAAPLGCCFGGSAIFSAQRAKRGRCCRSPRLWTLTAARPPPFAFIILHCMFALQFCCQCCLVAASFCLTMPTGGGGPRPGPPGWAPRPSPKPLRAHSPAPPACPAGPTSPTYSPTSPQHCKLCVGRCRGAHSRPAARSGHALPILPLLSAPLTPPPACPLPCSACEPAILWVLLLLELPGEHVGCPGGGSHCGSAGRWWEGQWLCGLGGA